MASRFKIFSRCEGAVAVEFAFILPVLLLICFGIIDFGHYWYMSHLASDASREGARYGTRFTGALPPDEANIKNFVLVTSGYTNLLPSDSNPDVKATGDAYISPYVAGRPLSVKVIATKKLILLRYLIPQLGSIVETTTMTAE